MIIKLRRVNRLGCRNNTP